MKVLGIETSCDETGVAVYCGERGLLAHITHSQIKSHSPYGGVVPEIAARDHIRKLLPLVRTVLNEAGLPASAKAVDGVAYTAGPGLVGALLVGATFARSLAYGWQLPAIGVNHLEGHLLAPMLETEPPEPPFVALLASGGHTMLYEVTGFGTYKLLGESVDDAAGEAFDKAGQLLGLGYPGGPAIAKSAEIGRSGRFDFPRPMTKQNNLNFSFSGLKTHVLYQTQRLAMNEQDTADVALAFEEAVVDTLTQKCQQALHSTRLNKLVVTGGVGANKRLRQNLRTKLPKSSIYYPRMEFCTDNGAMIAYTGHMRLKQGDRSPLSIDVKPRWPVTKD